MNLAPVLLTWRDGELSARFLRPGEAPQDAFAAACDSGDHQAVALASVWQTWREGASR